MTEDEITSESWINFFLLQSIVEYVIQRVQDLQVTLKHFLIFRPHNTKIGYEVVLPRQLGFCHQCNADSAPLPLSSGWFTQETSALQSSNLVTEKFFFFNFTELFYLPKKFVVARSWDCSSSLNKYTQWKQKYEKDCTSAVCLL